MKIALFTSNAVRHKFVANTISKEVDEMLVISESKPNAAVQFEKIKNLNPIEEHFYTRHKTEEKFFPKNNYFNAKTLPILHNEVNLPYVYETVKEFNPDMAFVYGASEIKKPLISLPNLKEFINLYLGICPYYEGAGTNFWPFVNEELEYIGATLLHADNGDIAAHIRPEVEKGDNVHTVGCKVIKAGAKALVDAIKKVESGEKLKRIKRWKVPNVRYYKKRDFSEGVLAKYNRNLENGLVEKYMKEGPRKIKLVEL